MNSTGETETSGIVREKLREIGIPHGSAVLCALSGGPDSVALLSILCELADSLSLRIGAAYIDHGIREVTEIEGDIELVRDLCGTLHVPVFIGRVPRGEIESHARSEGTGIENSARVYRYRLLYEFLEREGYDFLAVGHTEDDVLETMIMRFFRGSGVFGLRGIPFARERIIRPLISCSRERILGYLKTRNISCRIDSTNLETDYLRNKVRIELLPEIRSIFPGYRKSLISFSEKMTDAAALIERIANRVPWEKTDEGYRIPVEAFTKLDHAIQVESIYRLCDSETEPGGINPVSYGAVRKAVSEGNLKNGVVLMEGNGISMTVSGGFIFWKRDVVLKEKKRYVIEVPEGRVFSFGKNRFAAHEEIDLPGTDAEIWIPMDRIRPPLVVRSREAGDRIELERGTTKIKKLFNEWRIPEDLRDSIPVVSHREGVLAIIGRPFGYKNRISRTVRVLEAGEAPFLVIRNEDLGDS